MNRYHTALYLSMLLAFYGNSNGRWLAASFLGDAHHFNASFWSVAANVSKHRSNIRFHARTTRPNSSSSGLGSWANAAVLTMLCWDWLNTSFHLVYCNHESISTVGTFSNVRNRRSWASAFHCSISWTIGSISSSLPLPLPLPPPLPESSSSPSSPTSCTAARRACRSCSTCRASSTTQYRSRFSPNHDCNRTGRHISSSLTLFFSWA